MYLLKLKILKNTSYAVTKASSVLKLLRPQAPDGAILIRCKNVDTPLPVTAVGLNDAKEAGKGGIRSLALRVMGPLNIGVSISECRTALGVK